MNLPAKPITAPGANPGGHDAAPGGHYAARFAVWVLTLALVAALGLLAPAGAARAQGKTIGAYFTLVNTYIYQKAPGSGSRILVRPRLAFDVLDVTLDSQDRFWYKIVYPPKTVQIQGEGWTARPPHQLRGGTRPVLVFSRIPTDRDFSMEFYRVPAAGLELLNESQAGHRFDQLDWQKVRFTLNMPLEAWARGGAGIYRPGKTENFLSRVYGEMVTRNVDKETMNRLLSGVVHIGDTLRDTTWALGDPLRNLEEKVGTVKRTLWQYPELTVIFENEVVKQIE